MHQSLADMRAAFLADMRQFQAVFEQAPVGMALLTPDGHWLLVNHVLCAMLGYAEADLLSRTVVELTHPDDRSIEQSYVQQLLAGEIADYRLEKRYLRQDGSSLWSQVVVAQACENSAMLPFWITVIEDITDRKQAEMVLWASQERFELAVAATNSVIYDWDILADTLERTNGMEELLGYETHEIPSGNQWWIEQIHPDDLPAAGRQIQQALVDAPSYTLEYRVRHRQGHYVYVWDRGLIRRDAEGRAVRVIGNTVDITEQKQGEALLRFLDEASTVLAGSLDYETTLRSVSGLAVPRLADWCAVDLLADSGSMQRVVVSHVDPERVEIGYEIHRRYGIGGGVHAVMEHKQALLATGITREQVLATAQDETHRALLAKLDLTSLIIVPLVARGNVLGVMILATSGSRRQFSAIDLKYAEELARRAALAVDNARLYFQAQTAIQEREAFVSIAAHELKNPLTSLLGQTELMQRRVLREDGDKSRDLRSLATIADQALRLKMMLDVLLDVSRLRSGQFTLDRKPLDLAALTRRVVEEVETTLTSHTVTLICPAEELMISGDMLRLEQVLRNLIGNAIKYSPPHSEIRLAVERTAAHAVLTVQDQGIGIPPSALSHIFERFYQVDRDSSHTLMGFGIGLYVVKEIVTRHGGTIEVESSEGHGTTFKICFLLAADLPVVPHADDVHAAHDVRP